MIIEIHENMKKEEKQWWEKNEKQFKKHPEKFILQYYLDFMKNDQVMYAINYWLEKYELPSRIKEKKYLRNCRNLHLEVINIIIQTF
jgi:hypothetical protein